MAWGAAAAVAAVVAAACGTGWVCEAEGPDPVSDRAAEDEDEDDEEGKSPLFRCGGGRNCYGRCEGGGGYHGDIWMSLGDVWRK